jgi:hypothetical protein
MRLYKSGNGQWAGTQRDAQKNFPRDWSEVDVPTSKAELIAWLNENQVGTPAQSQPVVEHKPVDPSQIDPKAYSWVRWAYETLRRGDRKEAEAMLLNGLDFNTQREV